MPTNENTDPAPRPAAATPLRVVLDDNRRVSIADLEATVTHETMREWILNRISGTDRLLPLDRDHMERPARVFADLWRRSGTHSRIRDCMATACTELVTMAWDSPPQEWHHELLSLVTKTAPGRTRRFLEDIARRETFKNELITMNLDTSWLRAAAAYEPVSPDAIQTWRGRLASERYGTTAFHALARNLELGTMRLPDYCATLQSETRSLLLVGALRSLLAHGPAKCLEALRRYEYVFKQTTGLCDEIDAALDELQQPPAFTGNAPAPAPAQDPAPQQPEAAICGIALERAA